MNKRHVAFLSAALLVIAAGAGAFHITRFSVTLTGSREVPPVATSADGRFTARAANDNSEIDFRLRVDDMENVTMAHLHCAPPGQNGPIVATLFGMVPGGFDVDGELADYTLTAANIEPTGAGCSPAITNLAQLIQAMRTGLIYVNVHTVAHPGGEIRAQLGTFVGATPTPTTTLPPNPY